MNQMRKLLLGAALACGFATPAFAQSGHVDVSYANLNEDVGPGEIDIDITRVGGAIAFDLDPIGFQVDANYANWEANGDADVWGVGGHAYRRALRYLVGVYVGVDRVDDADTWTYALEGQYYTRNGTWSATLSHSDMDDAQFSGTALNGRYRHFVGENFSVHGGLGLGDIEAGPTDFDFWEAEAGAEYQFSAVPISLFASYRFADYDVTGADVSTGTATIGVRYNFAPTLIDRDRSGAGLDRVLPIFERLLL